MGKIKNGLYWANEVIKYLGIMSKTRPYYRYLLDSESKNIMKIRERNLFHHYNIELFIKDLIRLGKFFTIEELEERRGERIVLCIMDIGNLALVRLNYTKLLLDNSEWKSRYRVVTITDNICVDEKEFVIPIYSDAFEAMVLTERFGEKVYFPKYAEVLIGVVGNQYFDVFEAECNEIVCDCGAYDGTSELQISDWANNLYSKIYAFEPNEINCNLCEEFYIKNGLKNIELIRKGTWSENKTLFFSVDEESAGGRLLEEGTCSVPVVAIDNVISPEERVTYIKMDVEGAELESLKGAKETIMRHAPKLAICIYHRQDDLWKIPEYIKGLNKNYRFYIRHYCSYYYETVLYAIVK